MGAMRGAGRAVTDWRAGTETGARTRANMTKVGGAARASERVKVSVAMAVFRGRGYGKRKPTLRRWRGV